MVVMLNLFIDANLISVPEYVEIQVEFFETERTPAQDKPPVPSSTANPAAAAEPEKVSIEWPPPSRSASRNFLHAAVSCRNEYCAEIGRDILIRDGNAVDAAIATVVCMGAVHPYATGFGGGLMMIVHNRCVH
ncbi:hypothetical protein ANCCAN_04070 [Ancylostoma caninum]|uniref:Gamma-glutamyltranspeptidase n=1 Tax=Ancylostoma caninum TaxID=29170 RepID=A0A368H3J7_ANCCA|nr:hypothetical protein ANCCAN_04070 [Ancylostoma caninum]